MHFLFTDPVTELKVAKAKIQELEFVLNSQKSEVSFAFLQKELIDQAR